MAHVIRQSNGGLPTYFSPRAGRAVGNPVNGWTTAPDEALQFARARDAQEFLKTFLPSQAGRAYIEELRERP